MSETGPAEILRIEARALLDAADRLDSDSFAEAVRLLADTNSPVAVTGAGKSGDIARKVASTMTSTGTPAIFLHPADALHGGLGIVQHGSVVVAFSNSGETSEVLSLLPYLRERAVSVISVVGNADSTLGRRAAVVVDAAVGVEACPLGLAPTSSTTLALALGDALAVGAMTERHISAESFARNHPSGQLGRRLTIAVRDVMHGIDLVGHVSPDDRWIDVLTAITAGRAGAVLVLDGDDLAGLVTDGDVRRTVQRAGADLLDLTAREMMAKDPETVEAETLAFDALHLMEDRPSQISVLPVVDAGRVIGIVRVHDLVRIGL
jgi:arabinose-5-phosphate isomerase